MKREVFKLEYSHYIMLTHINAHSQTRLPEHTHKAPEHRRAQHTGFSCRRREHGGLRPSEILHHISLQVSHF